MQQQQQTGTSPPSGQGDILNHFRYLNNLIEHHLNWRYLDTTENFQIKNRYCIASVYTFVLVVGLIPRKSSLPNRSLPDLHRQLLSVPRSSSVSAIWAVRLPPTHCPSRCPMNPICLTDKLVCVCRAWICLQNFVP